MVKFPDGPLKTIGDHKVQVGLHTDVTVDITVSVLGDDDLICRARSLDRAGAVQAHG